MIDPVLHFLLMVADDEHWDSFLGTEAYFSSTDFD